MPTNPSIIVESFSLDFQVRKLNFVALNKFEHSLFIITGGSLGKYLCETLPNIKTEWDKWTIFFCDERVVNADDSDSTFG